MLTRIEFRVAGMALHNSPIGRFAKWIAHPCIKYLISTWQEVFHWLQVSLILQSTIVH